MQDGLFLEGTDKGNGPRLYSLSEDLDHKFTAAFAGFKDFRSAVLVFRLAATSTTADQTEIVKLYCDSHMYSPITMNSLTWKEDC